MNNNLLTRAERLEKVARDLTGLTVGMRSYSVEEKDDVLGCQYPESSPEYALEEAANEWLRLHCEDAVEEAMKIIVEKGIGEVHIPKTDLRDWLNDGELELEVREASNYW